MSTALTPTLGGLTVLEKDDQIAGLELSESFSLCHSAAWTTHLRDIVVVIHGDNYTSVAKNGFYASAVSEMASVESQLSFLHIKNALSQKEKTDAKFSSVGSRLLRVLTIRIPSPTS